MQMPLQMKPCRKANRVGKKYQDVIVSSTASKHRSPDHYIQASLPDSDACTAVAALNSRDCSVLSWLKDDGITLFNRKRSLQHQI